MSLKLKMIKLNSSLMKKRELTELQKWHSGFGGRPPPLLPWESFQCKGNAPAFKIFTLWLCRWPWQRIRVSEAQEKPAFLRCCVSLLGPNRSKWSLPILGQSHSHSWVSRWVLTTDVASSCRRVSRAIESHGSRADKNDSALWCQSPLPGCEKQVHINCDSVLGINSQELCCSSVNAIGPCVFVGLHSLSLITNHCHPLPTIPQNEYLWCKK
jgi:hypothetical protein